MVRAVTAWWGSSRALGSSPRSRVPSTDSHRWGRTQERSPSWRLRDQGEGGGVWCAGMPRVRWLRGRRGGAGGLGTGGPGGGGHGRGKFCLLVRTSGGSGGFGTAHRSRSCPHGFDRQRCLLVYGAPRHDMLHTYLPRHMAELAPPGVSTSICRFRLSGRGAACRWGSVCGHGHGVLGAGTGPPVTGLSRRVTSREAAMDGRSG